MKKILFITSITILFITILLFIIFQINISINKYNNKKVVETFNKTIKEQELAPSYEYDNNLAKLEINDTDYIGVLNITNYNLSLPIESKCQKNIIKDVSTCLYSKKNLIILGSNLRNSFLDYKKYSINDKITFTNTLGQIFQYEVNKIERISNLEDISIYKKDLIIAIKDYYSMNYILLLCDIY